MRLRAVEVRNWACIESLALTDLQDGVVVLHGPNRTGKSSLMQAIRSALFDHFHDSQEATLQAAIPLKSKEIPRVAIEFEHKGKRYRITKTFARTKEGGTTLEEIVSGSAAVLERGRQAAKKVRELIGAESSEAGIFQMLWLGQRDFKLPAPRDIDSTLRAALEEVLGNLITGRDVEFKDRLDKACERWFTVKTMQDKKQSPVTKLAAELEAARARQAEIECQWADAEAALKRYDEALARQPELKRDLEATDAELNRVQEAWHAMRERKAQFELAATGLEQCERLQSQADARLRKHDDAVEKLSEASKSLDGLQEELRIALETRTHAEHAASSAREAADVASRQHDEHGRQRADLDDRQLLIANDFRMQTIQGKLEQIERLETEHQALEKKLVGAAPVPEQKLGELRRMRETSAHLRAQLEAAEIRVTILAKKTVEIEIAKDEDAATKHELAEASEQVWHVCQHAEISIADHAIIRIGRGQENRDLDALARELHNLDTEFRAALTAAAVDPADPAALDHLVIRRVQHEEHTKRLEALQGQIAEAAPEGVPGLQMQHAQLRTERDAILARRPELAAWKADAPELERLRFDFEQKENQLKSAIDLAQAAAERAAKSLALARNAEQSLQRRIAAQSALVESLNEQLGGAQRDVLLKERNDAETRLADARRKLKESTLTEAEQALEAEFESVRADRARQAERLRQNENLLAELRGQLIGTEGLHQKRIQAEQTVNDRSRELDRESLYAGAHKHLKELFEHVRQEQVRRTVGPINDRVMQWAGLLDLNDYARLEFDGQLLPQGLALNHASTGDAVQLERESFGTLEQLSLLIRLAVGGLLARSEPTVAILDDPLAHADPGKHRKMLDILARAAQGEAHGPHPTGPLQLIVLTCHADRFDYLQGAQQIDLGRLIRRGG